MLIQRDKAKKTRLSFTEYANIMADETIPLKTSMKALEDLKWVTQEISIPYNGRDTIMLSEWRDVLSVLPNDLYDLTQGVFNEKGLVEFLMKKPLELIAKTLRKRRVTYLFEIKKIFYESPDLLNKIEKLWNVNITTEAITRANSIYNGLCEHFG